MRKTRTLSMLVAILMTLSLVTPCVMAEADGISGNSARRMTDDPFATMYDSDKIILEQMGTIVEATADITAKRELMSDMAPGTEEKLQPRDLASLEKGQKSKIGTDKLQPNDRPAELVTSEAKINAEIKAFIESGSRDMKQLDIPDECKAQLENVLENAREDRYIVKYKSNESKLVSSAGMNIIDRKVFTAEKVGLFNRPATKTELIVLDEKVNPAEFANQLRVAEVISEIEYIQPDFKMSFSSIKSDYSLNLTVKEIVKCDENLAEKEDKKDSVAKDGSEIIVALIDTGVDIGHSGLSGYLTNGWNFKEDNSAIYNIANPMEDAHGTHLAGIIKDASAGADVKIMPLKVFGVDGAYTGDIIEAIRYAEAKGASIANCSFGSGSYNPALEDVMAASDMLFVASVGNARSNLSEKPVYPACFDLPNLINVASLNADSGFSYYSNYSADLTHIAARGRDVYSTLPEDNYGLQSGTSMAAAQVSGIAGGILSGRSDLAADELKGLLIATGDRIGHLQDKVLNGRTVNMRNALNGDYPDDITDIAFEEDFDVNGYAPTPEESWQLFSTKRVIKLAAGSHHTLALCSDGTVWTWGRNEYGQLGNNTTTGSYKPVQVIGMSNATDIDAGQYHSFALKSDGTAWSWGYNAQGQLGDGTYTDRYAPVQVSGLTAITKIAGGYWHGLALKSDGTAWSWGANNCGQLGDGTKTWRRVPVQVSGLSGVAGIAGGGSHGLALKADGTVWSWGDNQYGQLGDNTTTQRNAPVRVNGLTNITAIDAGSEYNLALKQGGTAFAWGDNKSGQLGDSTTTQRTVPVQVTGLTGITGIAAGDMHGLAIKQDGTVWAWGENGQGQLGDLTFTDRYIPVQARDLSRITGIAAGRFHSLALKQDSSLWGWGYNYYGQVGKDMAIRFIDEPTQMHADIFDMFIPTTIAYTEKYYTLWIPETGTESLALNAQVLDQNNTAMALTPAYRLSGIINGVSVDNTTGVITVASDAADAMITVNASYGDISGAIHVWIYKKGQNRKIIEADGGKEHMTALCSDGTVWTWGRNNYGQLGDGTTTDKVNPTRVAGLTDVKQIASGEFHSLALKKDGTVWVWGRNNYGQLGDGTATDRNAPVKIAGLTGIKQIAGGGSHSLALKEDGTVWAWGYNEYGQLGDATSINRAAPVQVRTGAPGGLLTGIKQIAGGYRHSVALKEDGTVWAWGNNAYGQLGDGTIIMKSTPAQVTGLTGINLIATGSYYCLAVKSDDTVLAWGRNDYGQLGDGTTIDRVIPVQINGLTEVARITAGEAHSLALKEDGTVRAWGRNDCGQLGDGTKIDKTTPTQITGITGIKQIGCGDSNSLAAGKGGMVWVWGLNQYGQLGVGDTADKDTPTAIVEFRLWSPETPESMVFGQPVYTAAIPENGTPAVTVLAKVTDPDGEEITHLAVEYGIASQQHTGITVDGMTGVITISNQAEPGEYTITAAYEDMAAQATLKLVSQVNAANELLMDITDGRAYDISVLGTGINAFTSMEITFTYNPADLELMDLCTFTKAAETGEGVIEGSGLTFTSVIPGEITFTVNKAIPQGKDWAGILDIFRFKALNTTAATIEIST